MHILMCLISGAQRKPRLSQATLKKPRKGFFNNLLELDPRLRGDDEALSQCPWDDPDLQRTRAERIARLKKCG
jgi:hypothetical protein